MDVAFNQHSGHSWHSSHSWHEKSRSTTTLSRLSLAPLTSRLPLDDHDDLIDTQSAPIHHHNTSYLKARSTPTTPRLLSRSPARSTLSHPFVSSAAAAAALPRSKSTTHLTSAGSPLTPHAHYYKTRRRVDDPASATGPSDADWLFRAGALISSETRESKGQAWLVSRASSTSLAGGLSDDDDDADADAGSPDADNEAAHGRERARERELAGRHASRRGSWAPPDDEPPLPTTPGAASRLGSRSQSRARGHGHGHGQVPTPLLEQARSFSSPAAEGYFLAQEDAVAGPDFVDLDERLEAVWADAGQEDEAQVRRLVRKGGARVDAWFGNVLGWGLFSVEENEEEEDDDDADGEDTGRDKDGGVDSGDASNESPERGVRRFEGAVLVAEERIPPPKPDAGGWSDAAWLLSVASRVIL